MYLEERVEQLEALSIDHGKQSDLIAKGVAKLTIDTQQGIDDLKQGQVELRQELTRLADLSDGTNERLTQLDRKIDQRIDEVTGRFTQVDARFDEVDSRFTQVDARFEEFGAKQDEMRQDITSMRQEINGIHQEITEMRQDITGLKVGQELILQILREKLP